MGWNMYQDIDVMSVEELIKEILKLEALLKIIAALEELKALEKPDASDNIQSINLLVFSFWVFAVTA